MKLNDYDKLDIPNWAVAIVMVFILVGLAVVIWK